MGDGTPLGVRWIGWPPGDGYGDAAAQYLAALTALDVPVTWTPLVWPLRAPRPVAIGDYQGPLAHLAHRRIEHDTLVVHLPVDRAWEWLEEAGGRRAILYTTWETEQVPAGWQQHCEEFNTVLVPSTFNRDALLESGCRTEVSIVPHCARPVGAVEPATFDRIGDRFVFYTIGTWSTRKAMTETVAAFLDAFSRHDDVALVVKTTGEDVKAIARARNRRSGSEVRRWDMTPGPALAKLVAGRKHLPEVHVIAAHLPARDIDALHARGDCFLSLTRSEGFGLCIADALLFGNPVVVTGWGGHLDYLGADYPLLVDYDLVPTSSDELDDWFPRERGQRWAKARHDHAVDVLRWVAHHRDDAAALGTRIGATLARDNAPEVVGPRLLNALRRA